MNKLPPVERPYGDSIGLTGDSAYMWAIFLMNEADMNEDYIAYDDWKSMVESLKPSPGKAVPAVVHYAKLEEAIKNYGQN